MPPKPQTDQHKISVPAYVAAVSSLIGGVFGQARELGVRARFKITQPGTIENDGTDTGYVDTSEKAANQGQFEMEFSMDPAEPLLFPPLPGE
jgi:hypothetical protein